VLSVERFAALRARIEVGTPREVVLREAGLTRREWTELQRHWLDALAEAVTRGDVALAARYERAFLGDSGASSVPVPAPAPTPPSAPPLAPFIESSPLPVAFVPLAQRGTALGPSHSLAEPLPFRVDGSAPKPESAPPRQRIDSGTALAHEPHANEPPRGAGVPPPLERTAALSAAPSAGALPFRPESAEMALFPLVRYAALVAARQARNVDRAAVLARFGLDGPGHERIEALWQARIAQDPRVALEFTRQLEAATRAQASQEKPENRGKTALSLDATGKEASPGLPELTVEQYAWLVATLRKAGPEGTPAVLARMRLDPPRRAQLEAHWRERLARDPALRETFTAALARQLTAAPR
jgi:hypothetical protein